MAIDYVFIGQRIKLKRTELGITQEKLSELVGIGPSHMSHIENGSTVPSFEVFISILNALDCSADDLLCREVNAAKSARDNWLIELTNDCSATETKVLSEALVSLKAILRKNISNE